MKRVLVTGGAGFIGSNFLHYMLKHYDDIQLVNLDLLTYAGNLENLHDVEIDPRYCFVWGYIRDKTLVENLFNEYDFDTHGDRIYFLTALWYHLNSREGVLRMERIIERLGELTDTRRQWGNLRHKLVDIVFIGLMSVICGGTDFEHMEDTGYSKLEWFKQRLELSNGIPETVTHFVGYLRG